MNDSPRPDPSDSPLFTSRRRRRDRGGLLRVLALAGGALAVVVALVWWLGRTPEPASPGGGLPAGEEAVMTGDTSGLSGPGAGVVAREPFADLPALEESDAWVRDRAGELSPRPRWREWLGADGLVRRLVVAAVNVAAGNSPAEQLPFLAPADTFTVVVEGGRTYVDPASYRRYDATVEAITSVDARAAARFYRGISPLLDAAWRPLGLPGSGFDASASEAIDVVLSAEPLDGRVEVVDDGAAWAFVDPDLEAQSPATGHLLRLGPDNLRRLQDWVRTFAAAAGLP